MLLVPNDDITIGTGNVRTLRAVGKLEERVYEMDMFKDIFGLCEMKWKQSGKMTKHKCLREYYSGREDKHEERVYGGQGKICFDL